MTELRFVTGDRGEAKERFAHVLELPDSALSSINSWVSWLLHSAGKGKRLKASEGRAYADELGIRAQLGEAMSLVESFLSLRGELAPREKPIESFVGELKEIDLAHGAYRVEFLLRGLGSSPEEFKRAQRNFRKGLGYFRKVVAEPPEEEAKAMRLSTGVSRFKSSHRQEEYSSLARLILSRRSELGEVHRRSLRSLLRIGLPDEKRACLLQVLGELHEDGAAEAFMAEIRNCEREGSIPTTSQLVAISYVRLLRIPTASVVPVTRQLVNIGCRTWNVPFSQAKALKAGILTGLGSMADVSDCADLFSGALSDEDPDIVEVALYNLAPMWRRAMRRKGPIGDYREELERKLGNLLEKSLGGLRKAKEGGAISRETRLISEVTNLLALVNPDVLTKYLPDVFGKALEANDEYLVATVAESVRALSPEGQKGVVRQAGEKARILPEEVSLRLLQAV